MIDRAVIIKKLDHILAYETDQSTKVFGFLQQLEQKAEKAKNDFVDKNDGTATEGKVQKAGKQLIRSPSGDIFFPGDLG